jgi:hypothetical protein
MSSSQELILVLALVGLLVIAAALAGGLWWRLRARALVDVAHLADVLATRLRTLDALLAKLDAPALDRPANPASARRSSSERILRSSRTDPPVPNAVAGRTLISVPDLSASTAEPAAASASAELARRFSAIWELADTGASPESISRGTGYPIGQVELILGLRRQLETASAGSRAS